MNRQVKIAGKATNILPYLYAHKRFLRFTTLFSSYISILSFVDFSVVMLKMACISSTIVVVDYLYSCSCCC